MLACRNTKWREMTFFEEVNPPCSGALIRIVDTEPYRADP